MAGRHLHPIFLARHKKLTPTPAPVWVGLVGGAEVYQ